MKIHEITKKSLNENASVGATASGAVASAMPGGGAGFGQSIFMRRNPAKKKKSKK